MVLGVLFYYILLLILAGKVYLPPIIDCFDGLPVSWSIGTSPNAELVNTMLDEAILALKKDEQPIVHSDRGCHYRWPGWIKRMERAQLMRSMSKKSCSPDNSACEGFFGRLKNEMLYGYSWADITIDQFIEHLDEYLKWYAEKRIKLSLGGMSPLAYKKIWGWPFEVQENVRAPNCTLYFTVYTSFCVQCRTCDFHLKRRKNIFNLLFTILYFTKIQCGIRTFKTIGDFKNCCFDIVIHYCIEHFSMVFIYFFSKALFQS